MRIERVDFKEVPLEREEEFVIATGSSKAVVNFVVRIEAGQFCGFGSCCPSSVTGETPESIRADLDLIGKALAGEDPTNIQTLNEKMLGIRPDSNCARACLDIALWDLMGRAANQPLFILLGGSKDRMMTDMSIGINELDRTVEKAKAYVSRGFKAIKMKVGLDIDMDVAKVRAVRESIPEDTVLSVDANQGYDFERAVEFIQRTKDMRLAYVEQPVFRQDYGSLRRLRELSSTPIMVDESFKNAREASSILADRMADMLNIKVLKCGGITESLKIDSISDSFGATTQIGCYSESALSIAAGLHLGLAGTSVEFLDLDSHLSFVDDFAKGAVELQNGFLAVTGKPGLGFEVDFNALD
ncbi:MAG: mandelate racemase/muconate lactonizing enzyme family protein [Thermoplasmata archaeon]